MAIKQMENKDEVLKPCPRCSHELIEIGGQLTVWITCPKCKFTKLDQKRKTPPKVTSFRDRSLY